MQLLQLPHVRVVGPSRGPDIFTPRFPASQSGRQGTHRDGKARTDGVLLDYFCDEALRRRELIGLNKGEVLHALGRQLFLGRLGELRDRAFEDQMHRASCLHLLMAAIAAWNTVYLNDALATLRKRGEDIPDVSVAHIAPRGWEYIRLIRDSHFAPQSARSLENLCPLRLQEGEESA